MSTGDADLRQPKKLALAANAISGGLEWAIQGSNL